MKIRKAFKREFKPTKKQFELLLQHCGTARFAYNWANAKCLTLLKEDAKLPSAIDLHKEWVAWKNAEESDIAWAKQVSKCAPQFAFCHLTDAYKRYFKKLASKPRFKKRGTKDSFQLDGTLRIESERRFKVPILGTLKLKENLLTELKPKIVTISRQADRWYISFSVEVDNNFINMSDEIIGIDLGLITFATCSDGQTFQAPKPLKKQLTLLQRRSRQLSKKQKGSNNRHKAQIKLARAHQRISNIRKDFCHKVSTKLTKTKSVIVVESLNVRGMIQNKRLARSISDVGWGMFLGMLQYKSQWYGTTLIEADRFYPSSKLCSKCGAKKETLPLSERTYICEHCNNNIDRDLNAAINLAALATASSAGSNACGDGALASSMKQELSKTC